LASPPSPPCPRRGVVGRWWPRVSWPPPGPPCPRPPPRQPQPERDTAGTRLRPSVRAAPMAAPTFRPAGVPAAAGAGAGAAAIVTWHEGAAYVWGWDGVHTMASPWLY